MVTEQPGNQSSRIGKVILCTMKDCKAVPLLSNMHILSLTLRCTAIGLHLYLTPTFLVADHTVSLMLTLNWNVFCHKLAGLGSWPSGSACSGHRRVVIMGKTTNSTKTHKFVHIQFLIHISTNIYRNNTYNMSF